MKKKSIGCELQPLIFDDIITQKNEGILDHIQITVPNNISFLKAFECSNLIATIAHCNLLNTFGENNWADLQAVGQQIKALKPVHVVEHFTAFRPHSNEKTGLYFTTELREPKIFSKICDSIAKWQDVLGIKVCLENIAISNNVEEYFDLLLNVMARTDCGIACDVPHFLISVNSAKMDRKKVLLLANDLNPKQIHVGGLSILDGQLKDNHKLFSPWVVSEANILFENFEYITLEQNHMINSYTVKQNLQSIRQEAQIESPAFLLDGMGPSSEKLNDEIAFDAAKANGFPKAVRKWDRILVPEIQNEQLNSPLDLYNKYTPFFSPIATIELAFSDLDPISAVKSVTSLIRWSFAYLSWWYPLSARYAHIIYGEGPSELFANLINESDAPVNETYIRGPLLKRFISDKNFWVEVAFPRIENDFAAKGGNL